ncbi:MAG: 4-oxalocrotonate tautomerase family protein [Bacteroidota bacterium]
MPYINIKVTNEQVSKAQKRQLVERTTQLLVDVLDKDPATIHIVIDEVEVDNWGVRGQLYSELRKSS